MKKFAFVIISGMLLGSCKNVNTPSQFEEEKTVVAYVTQWEDNWGEGLEKAKQVTHINYAFANIKDGLVVEGGQKDTPDLMKLNQLKQINSNLKVLVSIGGWTWSGGFSNAVLTPRSRQRFANSAVAYMQRHKIDGIDLDWEYPGQPGAGNLHRPEDRQNFTAILKLLREKLDSLTTRSGEKYLLTIATGANQRYLDNTDMNKVHEYLDLVNIMTYDFHGGWEGKSGHNANLYASEYDDNEEIISAKIAVQQHVNAGVPIDKIVLGVPFYGRWWGGVNPSDHGLYQPAKGPFGSLSYTVIRDSLLKAPGYQAHWDSTAGVPFLWNNQDSVFVAYENARSLKIKTAFVKEEGMKGVMFWQFNGDDGELLQTIYKELNNQL
ncbi:glycoside hydrolase family 18 protein [Fulvivirga sp. M361]|uniref:glycoside hydrolase family 18 protein n=1 Tax=Fulvivirga sp. M361 TaxID=2594266 RepID=UPI00117B5EA1|nr:glycoside hydrolase family 18 protein [Fulvivirga sp. M361]TRX60751.1 glycoside hydrolase family 18 protein [Fulvivirga sp. M361]